MSVINPTATRQFALDVVQQLRAAGFEGVEFTRKPAGPLLTPSLQDPMWKAAVNLLGEDRIRELSATIFSYSITAQKP